MIPVINDDHLPSFNNYALFGHQVSHSEEHPPLSCSHIKSVSVTNIAFYRNANNVIHQFAVTQWTQQNTPSTPISWNKLRKIVHARFLPTFAPVQDSRCADVK